MLLQLIDAGIYRADWDKDSGDWLKSWSIPWFLGAIELRPGLRVLDVGSGLPKTAQYLATTFGCVVEALDAASADAVVPEFGLPDNVRSDFPDIRVHVGWAGQDTLPAESYDIVYCNSVLEHTYDQCEALNPTAPLAHINVLRDLVRMLRPGGLLLMNWDTYIDGIPHHTGWEFEADIWLLQKCGMRLADPRRHLRPARYIYDHPDTLFFASELVMPFAMSTLPRAVSINTVWAKPNAPLCTRLAPHPALHSGYFPIDEVRQRIEPDVASGLTTSEIDACFRSHMDKMRRALEGQLCE